MPTDPKKKKPIIVSNKNDPRYKAYQDSLYIYNKNKNIYEAESDISYDKMNKVLTEKEKDFNGPTYTESGKAIYLNTKPKQQIILEERKKLNPINIPFQSYNTNNTISTSDNLKEQPIVPKSWNITETTNYQQLGQGSREVKYKVDNPSLIDKTEMGPGNTRTITPKYFAQGGNLNNMKDNTLTQFNTGGTHSQNINGGIPQGKNNTVEEGETKMNGFVFSNRIKVNKDLIPQFNLPTYIKDKTYADASKSIDDKFKDRNDKASNETKKTLMDRLSKAHEYTKLQEVLKANSKTIPDMMNGEVPEGFEQHQMFMGGSEEAQDNFQDDNDLSDSQMAGLAGVTGLAGGLATGDVKAGIKGGVGGAANFFMPGASAITDPLIDSAAKLFENGNKADRARRDAALITQGKGITDFALGGPMPIKNPLYEDLYNKYNPSSDGTLNDKALTKDLVSQWNERPISISDSELANTSPMTESPFAKLPGQKQTIDKANLKSVGDWMKNNYGEVMRLAPVAMNAYQLSQLKSPGYERLNKLDQRFKPNYVDEKSLTNTLGNDYDNSVNALSGASNGSVGTLRSNIIGATAARTRAMSDAYLKASDINRNQDLQGQQFDLGVNQANIGQSNLELDINDRNKANYDTQKSKLLGQIGTDIGSIGKEEVYKRIAKSAYGYNWLGEYTKQNPDATPEQIEEAYKKQNQTKNKFGGFIKKY